MPANRPWEQWQAEFGQPPRQRTDQGSSGRGDSRAPSPAPRQPRDQLVDASKIAKKQAPKLDDSRAKEAFGQKANPDTPQPKPGYKQRRSAAEPKESHKPRQRKGPSLYNCTLSR
jgi:hypothetical protein